MQYGLENRENGLINLIRYPDDTNRYQILTHIYNTPVDFDSAESVYAWIAHIEEFGTAGMEFMYPNWPGEKE